MHWTRRGEHAVRGMREAGGSSPHAQGHGVFSGCSVRRRCQASDEWGGPRRAAWMLQPHQRSIDP